MSIETSSRHKYLVADVDSVVNGLEAAVYARDLPGMADVDSSLLYFCSLVKNAIPLPCRANAPTRFSAATRGSTHKRRLKPKCSRG